MAGELTPDKWTLTPETLLAVIEKGGLAVDLSRLEDLVADHLGVPYVDSTATTRALRELTRRGWVLSDGLRVSITRAGLLSQVPKNVPGDADCGRFQEVLEHGPIVVGKIDQPPDHYATPSGMQPFQVIDAFELDFYEGSLIKYVLRWRKKDGLQDLEKAKHYLEEIIERAQADGR